jgi:hypothetical protein
MAPPNIFGGQYIKEQSICLLIIVVCYRLIYAEKQGSAGVCQGVEYVSVDNMMGLSENILLFIQCPSCGISVGL